MQSQAPTVDQYIAQAPADRREALKRLRQIVKKTFKGCTEGMDYGMPTYRLGADQGAAFASQKNYIALYMCNADFAPHKAALKGASLGKGCIRYANPSKINFDAIEAVLKSTMSPAGAAKKCGK